MLEEHSLAIQRLNEARYAEAPADKIALSLQAIAHALLLQAEVKANA